MSADAVRTLRWNDEAGGFHLIGAAWRSGRLGRLGLATVLVGTVAAAVCVATAASTGGLSVGATALVSGLLAIGLALGLAAARSLPLPIYVIVALAIAWYAMLPAGGVAGTPLFALPPIGLLALGVKVAADSRGRWRKAWLVGLALGIGWLSRGAFGLAAREPWSDALAGIGLGLALGWVACRLVAWMARIELGSGLIALLASAVFALPWMVSLGVDPEGTAARVVLLARGLLLPLDLFWLWLGATTFQGAIEVGAWSTRTASRLVGARVIGIALPIVWVLFALFSWLATWPLPDGLAGWVDRSGLTAWAATWDDGLWFAIRWQVWATIAALVLVAVQRLRGQRGAELIERIPRIHGLWIAALLGVLGLWEAAEDAVAAGEDAQPATTWAALVLIAGIVWEVARSSGDWVDAATPKLPALLGGLTAVLAVIIATLGAGLPDLFVEYGYYAFVGVVVLGVPLAIADIVEGDDAEPGLSGVSLVGFALVGAATASLVLGIDPWAGPAMALGPLVWALVLAASRARLTSTRARVMAGAALGVGFGVFWLSPEALPLPFFDPWQQRYLSVSLGRPVFALGAFLLPLASMAAGIGIALALDQVRRWWRWGAVPAACGALALTAPLLPEIPGGPPVAETALPTIAGTPIAGWQEVSLAGTALSVDLPPGWTDLPRSGLLANRVEPRGRALVSLVVVPITSLAEAAARDRETWRTIAPERREGFGFVLAVGGRPALRTTWSNARSAGAEVWLALGDEGVLRVALLAEPAAFAELEPLLARCASSVRASQGEVESTHGPGSGAP